MMTKANDSATDVRNPFFARLYHYVLQHKSTRKDNACRAELLRGVRGTVIEVGPGSGPNLGHYPSAVERVIAVEPEPYLREKAAAAAAQSEVSIEVVAGDAEHLPVDDASVPFARP